MRASSPEPEANAVLDTGSKQLLGALVTFLQPLILGQGKKSYLFKDDKIHELCLGTKASTMADKQNCRVFLQPQCMI